MTILVKFFASLREQIGQSEMQLPFTHPMTVSEVWALACNNHPLPAHIFTAVNLEYVDRDTLVMEGDEVAFFPPVTGG